MSGSRAVFLPLAVTFGSVALLFLIIGQPVWMAFAPMACTFLVLALVRDGDGEEDEEPTADGS